MNEYRPFYYYLNNSRYEYYTSSDTCQRENITSSYYCAVYLITRFEKKVLYVNDTYGMVSFLFQSMVCPSQSKGTGVGNSHVQVKISLPNSLTSPLYRYEQTLNYRFTGLRYRMIENIYVSPGFKS